jgi:diguanylate cyclase (GGDEF)-like protein
MRQPADIGVVVLDLDGFKAVNDTYGHAAGDEVLQTVAARLRTIARAGDTVARLGGDEFAVLAPGMTEAAIAALSERIHDHLGEPYAIHGAHPDLGASVGTYLATTGESVEESLERADEAMYVAKRSRTQPAVVTAGR